MIMMDIIMMIVAIGMMGMAMMMVPVMSASIIKGNTKAITEIERG